MTQALILYGTEGCHLCDEAESLLRSLRLTWRAVDIADDDALLERYGTRIPVLAAAMPGSELDWPFGREDVRRLLGGGVS